MSVVKSALRTLMVIELLSEHHQGLTFAEIVTELDLPKSSAHSLLQTMVERGHLTIDPATKRYRIGIRLWEIGRAYDRAFDLPARAMPFMVAARDDLAETVQLAVLDGLENVYIAKVEADHQLVLVSRVGMRLPAAATGLGKVLLSGLSDDELARRFAGTSLVAYTPQTIVHLDELFEEIRLTRERGYALDAGEYTAGVRCVAVPVFDQQNDIVAAMSVSVPEIRLDAGSIDLILEVLLRHSGQLSRSLGSDRAPSRTS